MPTRDSNVGPQTQAEYPKFFWSTVGVSPSIVKQLSPADMEALINAFHVLTGADPLGAEKSPGLMWEEWKRSREGRVHGSRAAAAAECARK